MPNTFPSNSVGGGGATTLQTSQLPRLAPDLTWPSTRQSALSPFKRITFNAAGSLTTVLSATGRFDLSMLALSDLSSETITIKLTIDGIVIWNDTYAVVSGANLMGQSSGGPSLNGNYQVNSSLLFQVQTAADTSANLDYRLVPIL